MFGKLFPRMYVGATAGLIDGRHHKRLGAAWLLFLWCCLRQTGQGEEGIVGRGAIFTYAGIAEETGCARGSIREWVRRLVAKKYIRIERDRRGIRIFILNPKKFRVSNPQHTESSVSVETSTGRVSNPQHSKQPYPAENATASENLLQNNLTKLLRNNNTTAAAKSAAVSIPSVKELARDKTIHRMMSQAELDARRREMLLQAETIKRRYPPTIASRSTQAKAKPPAHAASLVNLPSGAEEVGKPAPTGLCSERTAV